MTNPDDTVMLSITEKREVVGLTKREYFAALAMQGICGNSNLEYSSTVAAAAEDAVQAADALIERLNKEKL